VLTFEQWMHLLAVLAWPVVAVIVCRTVMSLVYHGSRVIDVLWPRAEKLVQQESTRWRDAVWRVADRISPVPGSSAEAIEDTCERAFLAILSANGGIPASREEKALRALVREVREMYAELDQPTPAPPVAPRQPSTLDPDDLDPDLDEEAADQVFAEFVSDEIDAAEDES
jgi:hypothetical protein